MISECATADSADIPLQRAHPYAPIILPEALNHEPPPYAPTILRVLICLPEKSSLLMCTQPAEASKLGSFYEGAALFWGLKKGT